MTSFSQIETKKSKLLYRDVLTIHIIINIQFKFNKNPNVIIRISKDKINSAYCL